MPPSGSFTEEEKYKRAIPSLEEFAQFSQLETTSTADALGGGGGGVNGGGARITKLAYSASLDYISDWCIEYLEVVHQMLGPAYVAQKCCVTMDIDDTIISRNGSSNSSYVLGPTKKFFDACLRLGFLVYFITARPDFPSNVEWTKNELTSHGFSGYKDLFMISASAERNDTIGSEYKRKARNIIESRDGKSIVLNMGDRWSDLLLYPEGDRPDRRIHAHTPETRPDSLAFGLLKFTPPFWNYVAILPDTAWVSVKIADSGYLS